MEYLQFLTRHFAYALGVLGLLLIIASLVRFAIRKGGVDVQGPGTAGRWVLGILGAVLVGAAFVTPQPLPPKPLPPKYLKEYYSYIAIEGDEVNCTQGKCTASYFDTATLVTTDGSEARYEGRAKTKGKIVSLKTVPPHEVLNPEQYPANPTYLEFAIAPRQKTDHVLFAQGEAVIENEYTPTKGKIGPHIPYFAESVVVIVDLRHLGFKLQRQLQAKIEAKRDDNKLVSGHIQPIVRVFGQDALVMVSAQDVPAGSSVLESRGD